MVFSDATADVFNNRDVDPTPSEGTDSLDTLDSGFADPPDADFVQIRHWCMALLRYTQVIVSLVFDDLSKSLGSQRPIVEAILYPEELASDDRWLPIESIVPTGLLPKEITDLLDRVRILDKGRSGGSPLVCAPDGGLSPTELDSTWSAA